MRVSHRQLLNLNTGETLDQYSDYNGQIGYGEDVISRIEYSQKAGGLKRLQEVVVSTINNIIKELLKKNNVDIASVSHMTLAGNTTMTQPLPLELELVYKQQCILIDKANLDQAIELYKRLLMLHLQTKAVTTQVLKGQLSVNYPDQGSGI